jgi:pimeloyl-ACP methyl ester carboxylesterase
MWRKSVIVCDKHYLALSVMEWSRRGFPCVLLHGLGDAGCVWNYLAIRIMSDFRTVAVDLRGHGDSDWDPETRYDTDALTDDLTKIIAALGFERVILIGHSLGAAAAIRFAAHNAARVAALVIVDFGPELDQIGVDEVLRGFADMPRTFASVEEYFQWLMAHRPLADPDQLRHLARCSLRQSPSQVWELKADAALATNSQISKLQLSQGRYHYPELWSALKRIKCPSQVIRGLGSGVLPHDVAARMTEQTLSAGRLATIGGAGHAIMIDNPGEFSRGVINFLTSIAAEVWLPS